MRTYTKLSALAATFLISALQAQEISALPTINEALKVTQTPTAKVETAEYKEANVIRLPNNGIIYATEDMDVGNAVLNAVAPSSASFSEGVIEPVVFYIRSNYAAFIDKMELSVYRISDIDLIDPLAVIPVRPSSFTTVSWDGKIDKYTALKAGDELVYVLRAYDKGGKFDETITSSIQLLKPEDVLSNNNKLAESISKEQGVLVRADEAVKQYMLDKTFAVNMLSKHNIIIYGSRITVRGTSLPEDARVSINHELYPIDFERKFAAEYIVPAGTYYFDIDVEGEKTIKRRLRVDIENNRFFGIAISDFTLGKSHTSEGYIRQDGDVLQDGRLAFYVKGKAYGKYQITAEADTTEKDMKQMFKGFTQADAVDMFQSLDPDMYYPTYGDDSVSFRDVNTQGRFYVRADWDKSQILWGNYNTDFDGTQYGGYSRSLYGAKLDFKSIGINKWGDSKSVLKVFGSEANSAQGHSEFLGTGGSLYYLKNTNVVPGSDKILLQVTDISTGNVLARIDLIRGADYEIDNIQGRVILSRPLSQIVYQGVPSITSTASLNGYEQRLIADYEFVPNGFDSDFISAGVRGKQWIGDYIALGGTYVKEERDGEDYEIIGGDITLQAGKGTYLKAEFTETNSNAAPIYYSNNGGLTFSQLGAMSDDVKGDAVGVNGRVNFKELGLVENELSAGAWWRNVDKGYSNSHSTSYSLDDVTEYGAELAGEINKDLNIYTKANIAERDTNKYSEAQVTAKYNVNDKLALSAEVKGLERENSNDTVKGALGALRVDYDITPSLETFLTGQFTLDNDNGAYDNNDAVIVGARYLYDASNAEVRYTTGHRGEAFEVDVSHQLTKDHKIYGGYTWSDDYYSDYDTLFNSAKSTGFTVGQRWNITNSVSLYNESQVLKNSGERGTTNSLGMDFYAGEGWTLGFLYQNSDFNSNSGDVDREAFSFSLGRTSSVMNWMSKLEYREDRGAEERDQWVTTNRLSYKVNESWRLAGRFNYSKTDDRLDSQNGAQFIESNIGFAYRPFDTSDWALFGKYTYLYDLASLGQSIVNGSEYDQKSQVISLEGVYKLNEKWEFALKYATRIGDARYGRGEGEWFDSRTSFYAGQVRYDLLYKWHALVEYRLLDVQDGGVKQGYLLGVDRDITNNLRLGLGYNFTDFSDDLTKFDYKYRGWFINVVGIY